MRRRKQNSGRKQREMGVKRDAWCVIRGAWCVKKLEAAERLAHITLHASRFTPHYFPLFSL
jgi:hypothetical protein